MKVSWEGISAVANALTALAAIGAAFLARAGLGTWRQQLVGEAEYDVARRVLRSVLELRDQVAALRREVRA